MSIVDFASATSLDRRRAPYLHSAGLRTHLTQGFLAAFTNAGDVAIFDFPNDHGAAERAKHWLADVAGGRLDVSVKGNLVEGTMPHMTAHAAAVIDFCLTLSERT